MKTCLWLDNGDALILKFLKRKKKVMMFLMFLKCDLTFTSLLQIFPWFVFWQSSIREEWIFKSLLLWAAINYVLLLLPFSYRKKTSSFKIEQLRIVSHHKIFYYVIFKKIICRKIDINFNNNRNYL